MAHKVGSGSTKNGRDSLSKRLGLKVYFNSKLKKNSILLRQKGYNYHGDINFKIGKEYTLYAVKDGIVSAKSSFTDFIL